MPFCLPPGTKSNNNNDDNLYSWGSFRKKIHLTECFTQAGKIKQRSHKVIRLETGEKNQRTDKTGISKSVFFRKATRPICLSQSLRGPDCKRSLCFLSQTGIWNLHLCPYPTYLNEMFTKRITSRSNVFMTRLSDQEVKQKSCLWLKKTGYY